MTNEEIIDAVIAREGGLINDPADKGGATFAGVSKVAHPELWVNGPPSLTEVRALYLAKYIVGPGFDQIPDEYAAVKYQLADWGVNSGPQVAIFGLQRVVGVSQDGKLGPATMSALLSHDLREVNNKLVKERCMMIVRVLKRAPSQIRFATGWFDRALSFLL